MAKKVGPNSRCPCGSGKKYKNCCMRRGGPAVYWTKLNKILLAVLVVVAAGAVVSVLLTKQEQAVSSGLSNPAAQPLSPQQQSSQGSGQLHPQPPGPIPEGKYWSPSRGEWLDIPDYAKEQLAESRSQSKPASRTQPPPPPRGQGNMIWSPQQNRWLTPDEARANRPPAPSVLAPQPPGPAPAGKVWSPEHNHWHDIGDTGAHLSSQPSPEPPGPPPTPGSFWSPEHGHWHNLPTEWPPSDSAGASPGDTAAKLPAKVVPLPNDPE